MSVVAAPRSDGGVRARRGVAPAAVTSPAAGRADTYRLMNVILRETTVMT